MYKILAAAVLLIGFSACQKEISLETPVTNPSNPDGNGNGGSTQTLAGNYDFVGMVANGSSAVRYTEMGVTATITTYFAYRTTNNSGTCVFTSNHITSNDMKYDIDTTLRVVMSAPGIPNQTETVPFQYSMGPTSSEGDYVLKGTDSLVTSSVLFSGEDLPSGTLPGSSSAHIGWSGDTLLLTSGVKGTYSQVIEGTPVTQIVDISTTMKFKKK